MCTCVFVVGCVCWGGVGGGEQPPAADRPLSAAGHDEVPDTFQHFNNKWADREWWWRGAGSVVKCNNRLFWCSVLRSVQVSHVRTKLWWGHSYFVVKQLQTKLKARAALREFFSLSLALVLTFISSRCFPSIKTPLQISTFYFWFHMLLLEDGPTSLPTRRTAGKHKHRETDTEDWRDDRSGSGQWWVEPLLIWIWWPLTSFFPPSDRSLKAGLNTINQRLTDYHRLALLPPFE